MARNKEVEDTVQEDTMRKEENIPETDVQKESKEETKLSKEQKRPKMEKIFLFKDNNEYKDDVFVSVNGENYHIQRGVEVEVPDYIAEVLRNQQRQDQRAMEAGKEFKQ